MTKILNDKQRFATQALSGLVAAYGGILQEVEGGVIRRSLPDSTNVRVVVGGGSGHYPGFAGWVGEGLADAAVAGNVFASPSTAQICSVVRATQPSAGVLLMYGNYAGDVLNFEAAAQTLRDEGIDVRTLAITDDVASSSPEERSSRRGIAGDLVVIKVASAAAARGFDIEKVERVAHEANDSTVSIGAAFSGCTLPGATEPLFTVEEGSIALGMGVHGEPGLGETSMMSSNELAGWLVEKLAAEAPSLSGGSERRLAVILNGLGGTKYEELFVLFNDVTSYLGSRGWVSVNPLVGEYMTSLDMAGVSLTVGYLSGELEDLWNAPCHAAAFVRTADAATSPHVVAASASLDPAAQAASEETKKALAEGDVLWAMSQRVKAALESAEGELGRLDSIAGDGDHGRGMLTGLYGALESVRATSTSNVSFASLGERIAQAGDAWGEAAGGTSGALWGHLLRTTGNHLATNGPAVFDPADPLVATNVATAVSAGVIKVCNVGGARLGDKTMVDAALPFAEELERQANLGLTLAEAWEAAGEIARTSAQDTAQFAAKKGRSHNHKDKTIGVPDPGAVSFALIVRSLIGSVS